MSRIVTVLMATGIVLTACQAKEPQNSDARGAKKMTLAITSTAFTEGGMIPVPYTCDGADISPPLSWNRVPKETKSLALICDDPDAPAGTWVHWVIYNIPPDSTGLPEKVPPDSTLSIGARQGISDFRKFGYGGPCPPGGTHRYYFKLYALDTALNLSGRVTKADLLAAMDKHILAEAQLMGKYRRK